MKNPRSTLQIVALSYFTVILGIAVLPPSVAVWNQINPHIFGLPFAQFSILAFAAALSSGLVAWYAIEGELNKKEAIERARIISNE